ncbi:MAG: DUF882 domain-containing protein [Nitrospirota bacterium]
MISRRNFLRALVAGTAFLPFKNVYAKTNIKNNPPSPPFSKGGKGGLSDIKILNMYNVHTGEKLNIKYYSSGNYDQKALDKINYFLRCHYTNEVKEIDIGVLDILCDIKDIVGKEKEIQIISGYRSIAYNELLISQGRNVSRNTLHLHGLAIDFSIDGVSNGKLCRIAKSFAAGGVGRYPEFVHIDVGRVRYW